jgi:hypothetical protein
MSGKSGLVLNKMFVILILLSMFATYESRFVWDFGSYCLDYCAKIKYKLSAVSICSCQWISSNHRRSAIDNNLFFDNDQPLQTKTFLVK